MSIAPQTRNTKFWQRIRQCDHQRPCVTCCWLWQGARNAGGYGRVGWQIGDQQETYAHRIAWFLLHGRLPAPGLHIAHTCDTPACCNPSHLQEMTVQENHQDSAQKGRRSRQNGAPMQLVIVRMGTTMLARIDAYRARLKAQNPAFRVERGEAMRDLLLKALALVNAPDDQADNGEAATPTAPVRPRQKATAAAKG